MDMCSKILTSACIALLKKNLSFIFPIIFRFL